MLDCEVIAINGMDMPAEPNEQERFYALSPMQAYGELLTALNVGGARFKTKAWRRILFLSGARGVGAGHFMSALTPTRDLGTPTKNRSLKASETTDDYNQLGQLLWAINPKPNVSPKTVWRYVLLSNLRLSHDGAACIEQIAEILERTLRELLVDCTSETAQFKADIESLKEDRLSRLEYLVSKFQMQERRVAIILNGIGVFFERNGRARNGFLRQAWKILIGKDGRQAPIDLILIGNEEFIPREFRNLTETTIEDEVATENGSPQAKANKDHQPDPRPVMWLPRIKMDAAETRDDKHRRSRFNDDNIEEADSVLTDIIAAHHLYRSRASVIGGAYFPVALGMLAIICYDQKDRNLCVPKDTKTSAINTSVARILYQEYLRDHFVKDLQLEKGHVKEISRLHLKNFSRLFGFAVAATMGLPDDNEQPRLLKKQAVERKVEELIEKPQALIEHELRLHKLCARIFDACGRGRHAITLFYAMMMEVIRTGSDNPEETLQVTIQRLEQWIERTLQRLERKAFVNRRETVSEVAIELFHERDKAGRTLPVQCKAFAKDVNLPEKIGAGPETARLIHQILSHMAIMGSPVEIGVLAACPAIVDAALSCLKSFDLGEELLQSIIEWCVFICKTRCLVIKIEPFSALQTAPRYSLHRSVQSVVFRRFGNLPIESIDSDQHTISFYVSQPDHLPQLSTSSERYVRAALEALIGLPNIGNRANKHQEHSDPETVKTAEKCISGLQLRADLFRAAFGIMRSVYSIAVLARHLQDGNPSDPSKEEPGLFESYRRSVLWLLRSANEWDVHFLKAKVKWPDSADLQLIQPAFLPDEIAWLCNESALLSLAQGRLFDAHVMFENATTAAARFAPLRRRPTQMRIRLNWALCQLELGRTSEARRLFTEIWEATDETIALPFFALGYLGLIEHLAGNLDVAREHYRRTTKVLQTLGRTRATAIFLRHWSDLERFAGENDNYQKATLLANQAAREAREGRHEDIYQLSLLSVLNAEVARSQLNDQRNAQDILRNLSMIEAYGKFVGMERILVEVELTRARLHMKLQDSESALECGARLVEIASTHGMRFWRVAGLRVIAVALREMEKPSGARTIDRVALSWSSYLGRALRDDASL
jgi:tetratricopeptide (TPR) repeat protein